MAIISFSPSSGGNNTSITVFVTNFIFGSGIEATIGGTAAIVNYYEEDRDTVGITVSGGSTGQINLLDADSQNHTSATSFTYYSAPTISSFTPTSGVAGVTITIAGTNFIGATSVTIGGTNASSYSVVSATSITAVIGSGATGTIVVTTPGGTATSSGTFTYISPQITSFTPVSGITGTSVIIYTSNFGTNNNSIESVTFGGTDASSYTYDGGLGRITAIVAGGSTGDVVVENISGVSAALAGFTYYAVPTILFFIPTEGGTGTTVTIIGTNFSGTTSVTIGGTNASSYSVNSATNITAVVASGTTGQIAVTNPAGTATSIGTFSYFPAPTISSFTPTTGVTGTTVAIAGTNFYGTTSVKFGGTEATSFEVVTTTGITAVVASGTTGAIVVTNPGGTATSSGTFTYIPPPTITSFTPETGATGATVTITGTNFTSATAVTLGGTAAAYFIVDSGTSIRAVVASGTTGQIAVTNPAGTATSTGTFTFIPAPTITSFTPKIGTTGTVVRIFGTNLFVGTTPLITSVTFGGVAATAISVNTTDGCISATVGNGNTGNVIVTSLGGSFNSSVLASPNTTFTYDLPPTISSFTPTSGYTGTVVIISGTNLLNSTAVTIGGTEASSITITNSSEVRATVAGGSSGTIVVTAGVGSATSATNFTFIPPPTISSFVNSTKGSGTIAGTGNTVTITGTNFKDYYGNTIVTGATGVKFGGTNASSYSVVSATSITAIVGSGTTGAIRVTNSTGHADSSTFTYNVTPTAVAQSVTTNEDTAVSITLVGTDPEDALTYTIATNPTKGTLSGTAPNLTFTPTANLNGSDSFTFTVNDGYTTSTAATVSITITAVNDPPVANSQSVTTLEDTAVSITLTGSDPVEGSAVTYTVATNPTKGTLSGIAPNLTFTPTTNLNGSDSFTFTVNDGNLNSAAATVSISITAVNDSPSFTKGADITVYRNTGAYSSAWATNLSAGPSDESGQTLSFTVTNNNNSLFSVQPTVNASGVLSFTPTTNRPTTSASSETATVTISVQDDGGTANGGSNTSANQTFVITVAFPTPTISSGAAAVDPNVGGLGTTVTINGTNFRDAGNNNIVTVVSFGGTAATSFTVVSATSITAVVGSGTTGTVLVTTYGGTATKASAFTFFDPPTISSFTPTSRAAGLNVVITGTNFTGVTSVSFGGTSVELFTVNSSSQITATVGSGSSGIVSVTNPGGTATLAGFTIIPAPTISSFTAASGKTGDTITITGTSFSTASTVAIGGTAASSFTIVSTTSITAVVSNGTTGVITVTTEAGTATSSETFTYYNPPTITSFTPTSGVVGTTVTLTGTYFTGATVVRFGGTNATSFTVVSATSITAVVGSGTDGVITVISLGGTATSSGTFDFFVSATLPTDNFSVLDVIAARSTVFPSAVSTTSLKYLLDTYSPNRVNDSLKSLRDFGGYTFSNLGG